MRAHFLTGLAAFAVATGAEEAELDPYVAFPDYFPQHYRTLADVPEEYHDGEKLTGCFIDDTFREDPSLMHVHPAVAVPDFVPTYRESVFCHNPFYLDEHGRIKNDLYAGDPSAPPPSGRPLGWEVSEMPPAPCEGCLTGEQVLSIFKEYHRNLGVQPLGYSVELVKGYPWDGIGPWKCKKHKFGYVASIYPDPLDPHPNERVNMRRVRSPVLGFNELCDGATDPQGRDLTWWVTFQIGWSLPEYRRYDEHNQHQRRWPRTPCIEGYTIHSESGEIVGTHAYYSFERRVPGRICEGPLIEDVHLLASHGREAWDAFVQVHRRISEHLPNAPGGHSPYLDFENAKRLIESAERENQDERNRRWLERERKELRLPTRENAGKKLQRENRSGPESPFPPGASATPSGTQQIVVYWGDDPSIDKSAKCIDKEGSHLPRCASRVPKSRRCDIGNIPLEESDPRAIDNESVFECILWARLNGVEQCWYRDSANVLDTSWCAKGHGNTYGEGMASKEIRRHIAAVETLTGHQVGMRLDDADFALQKKRLEQLFPAVSFSNGDRFAEINVFSVEHWEKHHSPNERQLGHYQHRFGGGKYDDPFYNKKENEQYRRISVPYDWLGRGAWCHGDTLPCAPRHPYVLVHEGAHDVFASHLYDQFLWNNVPALRKYAWQTLGVDEGFGLYIEEIAGRRRKASDLGLDRTLSGLGDYVLPTPSVGQRKKGLELATSATKFPTAQAMLVALRGVEDALKHEIDSPIYDVEAIRRFATRTAIVNHSLHSFNHLLDWFSRPNMHVDFCEFRNEVHRRVWVLKKLADPLASPDQPHVNAAFDAMDIPTCARQRIKHEDCNEESGDPKPSCIEVSCEFSPGDLIPVLIPMPDGVSISQCSISISKAEVKRNASGTIQVCITTTVRISDSTTIVIVTCRTF